MQTPNDWMWRVAQHDADIRHLQSSLSDLKRVVTDGDRALEKRMDEGFSAINDKLGRLEPDALVRGILKGRSTWHLITLMVIGLLTIVGWFKSPDAFGEAMDAPKPPLEMVDALRGTLP